MIQVSILHCPVPERRPLLVRLKRQLGRRFPVRVIQDRSREGIVKLTQRAHQLSTREPFHLILQDDSYLHRQFWDQLLKIIDVTEGEVPLGLWSSCPKAKDEWLIGNGWGGGVAWCFPSSMDAAFGRWLCLCRAYAARTELVAPRVGKTVGEDALRSAFLLSKGIREEFPRPFLVSHGLPGVRHPSLVGNDNEPWFENAHFLKEALSLQEWRDKRAASLVMKKRHLTRFAAKIPERLLLKAAL